jgi:hypothetical protein
LIDYFLDFHFFDWSIFIYRGKKICRGG